MKKLKNIFKYLAASLALIATGMSCVLLDNQKHQTTEHVASAAFSTHSEISNSLPQYMKVNGLEGNDIKDIFLLNSAMSLLDISIANQSIKNLDGQTNPAYYEELQEADDSIPSRHYYFDFTSSLSLYKNLSNVQIQNGASGENILNTQSIDSYRTTGEFPISSGAMFTPKKLNIQFALNTAGKEVLFQNNKVILNEEGIYTLVIPALVYYTENSGASYTLLDQQATNIYYTFMVFDSTTYFKGAGTQNVTFSNNLQTSVINSSETYSLYHFYNYAYSQNLGEDVDAKSIAQNSEVNTLPHLSYNYKSFKVNIKYTDIDDNSEYYHVEYQNGQIVILDELGQEFSGNFSINATLSAKENEAKITFINLGEYEITFDYLYIVESNGETFSYALPLEENLTSDEFQNKAQKVYVYGYQAMFADYANPNPATNQPSDKELKGLSIDSESSRYIKNADITSEVNSYIKTTGTPNLSGVTGSNNIISNSSSVYTAYLNDIANAAIKYANTATVTPVSTNQPPIKFITNATAQESYIYNVTGDAGSYSIDTDNRTKFEGFNQNTPGTYCYVVQYSYKNYMSTAGTLQGEYSHYQVFFFTITNTIPSVTVYEAEKDENDKYVSFSEIPTRGFTNKDVFILNNAKNNDYDAPVTIEISAYNYNNDSYYFAPTEIDKLTGVDPRLVYTTYTENFDGDSATQDIGGKDGKESKYGILIKNTASYANAKFTISIKSATTKEPSVQTFTIDTQAISNVTATNVNRTSSSYYSIAEAVQASGVTNRPIAFSWSEKNSEAKTYGYLKHIPFSTLNNYPSNSFSLSTILGQLLSSSFNMLPVYNKIDFSQISKWGEYSNSLSYSNNLPATNVRSENGIYILQVYDQAGNYTFEVFMIDNTSPIFVQYTKGEFNSYEFIQNSANISVPAEGTDIYIQWAKYKGIYIGDSMTVSANGGYAGYEFSGIKNDFFEDKLNEFLSGKTKEITKLTESNMNGYYFISEISDLIYVKDRASFYSPQTSAEHSFKINFFETINNKQEANEGTVKIIVRDSSNGHTFQDQYYSYLNYPSSYVSFTITSDRSQFTIYKVKDGVEENLEGESYSHIADLYYKNANGTGDLTTDSDYGANTSGFRIKYSYRPAIKTTDPLFVSYIPVLEDGTTLDYVDVKYYPYETARKEAGSTATETYYYYYKDIAKEPQIELRLFEYDPTAHYEEGKKQENALAFGQDSKPLAGKYVITRQYRMGDNPTALANTLTKAYDFFTREITFYVDNYGIITSLESVQTTDPNDSIKTVSTGLESIVGGDIVLNMHSGKGSSDISISFPSYKDNGLNSGSFFTKTSFSTQEESTATISLETNKLPLALYIPKYKYTISSVKDEDQKSTNNNSFTLTLNDYLSYFGDVMIHQNSDANYEIVLNGQNDPETAGKAIGTILPEIFDSEKAAYEYLYQYMSIAEYELSAEITWVDSKDINNRRYYSTQRIDGTAHYYGLDNPKHSTNLSSNYLAFYERPTGFGGLYGNQVDKNQFKDEGTYYINIYQGANDTNSDIYSVYRIAFEITSAQPEFEVLNYETKTVINSIPSETLEDGTEIIYTNAKQLRIQWEEPTDPYLAKIDKTQIKYGLGEANKVVSIIYNDDGTIAKDSKVQLVEGTSNSYYFDIPADMNDDCVATYGSEWLQIEFQFENHGDYYEIAKKRILFDVESPTESLNTLMNATASSTKYLTTSMQQLYMRQYIDYTGKALTEEEYNSTPASYIYNVNNGAFANYAFVVDRSFLENLKDSFYNAGNADNKLKDGTNISEVYFNEIADIKTYNQSDKSTFLDSFEPLSSTDVKNKFRKAGYYEIIETDWAGNRTIYVIYLKDPNITDDNLSDMTDSNDDGIADNQNIAISFTDHKTEYGKNEIVYDSLINTENKTNIYANTGFSIKSVSYNQDPWLYFTITTSGSTTHYFKSPRLTEENQAYKISFDNGGFVYTTVNLKDISTIETSSQNKHKISLANRMTGQTKTCYLTVMDSSLIIEKITENVAENKASIAINVPSIEQVASETKGYIYPVQVKAQVYDITASTKWNDFTAYEQTVYGDWTAVDKENENNDFMTFETQSSTYVNKVIVSVEAGVNERVKFIIVDNFGNEHTTISLTGNSLTEELDTINSKLYSLEDAEGRTYISTGTIIYRYNAQLYRVEAEYGEIVEGVEMNNPDTTSTIKTITFQPTGSSPYYNGYFKLNVYDESSYDNRTGADNSDALVKTFYVRLYNKLPATVLAGEDPTEGIIFLDKKYQNIGADNIKTDTASKPLYLNVEMDGKTYAGAATTVTTYSRNVTVRFRNGLSFGDDTRTSNYNRGITYSAYLSKDDGESWQNIDNIDSTQAITTYTISGVGRYLILIKYNDEEILTDSFKLYEVNILDSASSYYYLTVNGQHVEKSAGIKYTDGSTEYEITYIIALEYADRNNSLGIHTNEELEVQMKKIKTIYPGGETTNPDAYPDVPSGTIVTEIYSYWCDEAKGDFVIIYIPQSQNIVGTMSYELPSGETESLKDGLDKLVVADKDTASTFNRLKISYTAYYGVAQNKIIPIVYKVLNGEPVQLNTVSYKTSDSMSYIYLEMSGTYYIQMIDSCTPANAQIFSGKRLNGYEYVEITFLSNAPFEIITTNDEGEEYVTAPVQKAIYNNPITISLTNVASYYLPSADLTIEATKNGAVYDVTATNNTYTFSEPGFYTVKFHATSSTGVLIREEAYSFTIINKNESRYAFEFAEYGNYYIEKVLKDGVDITEDLINISNFKTVMVGNKPYLSSITLNHLDEKTGKGRYEITVNLNDPVYSPVKGERFTFSLWINLEKPPINVSLAEGAATTDAIRVYFNPQSLYKAVGDCYVQIGGTRYEYTSENIESAGESKTITINGSGTYFIQVYTQSGHLLYSYKVIKNEPLNSFAIIAIILGVAALGAIIFITVKLRKRQKVK